MKMMNIIKAALFVVIVVLTYFLVETISEPIRFEKEKAKRYAKVIERLKNIRTAQLAYRDVKGEFATDWDELLNVIKNDRLRFIKVEGNPDDSTDILAGIKYDTIYVPIIDTFFVGIDVDSLPMIPFAEPERFTLSAGKVNKGNVEINVFEVIDSKPFDKRKVLKVGSMTDANFSGNWE